MTGSKKREDLLKNIMKSLLPVLDKNVLVLLTGGCADYAGYQQTMDELMLTEAKMAITPSFYKFMSDKDMEWIRPRLIRDGVSLYDAMEQIDLIVIPILTRNTLAKGAMGIQDNLVSMAIAKGFMTGIPILAVNENCDPNSAHSKEKGIHRNVPYNQMLLGYEERWKQFGATLIEPEEFTPVFKKMLYPELSDSFQQITRESRTVKADGAVTLANAQVITMSEVQGITPGQTIRVSEKALITPLAKEALDEKKAVVERI